MEKDTDTIREEHHHPFLTAFLILLTVGLIGVGWYAYTILQRHDSVLTQTQSQIPVIQKYVMSLDERANGLETKISDGSTRQEELRAQFNRARGDLMARIDSAKKQASEASATMMQRVRSDIATQIDGIKTQLAKLKNAGDNNREQIASLQQELAQVRSQVNQQGEELASVQGRVTQNAASSEQAFAAVKITQQQDRHAFNEYADKFAVKRVDFEAAKDRNNQIAPGISLQVNDTDVSYQRVNGSVLASDGHTTWLRQLKVQEPVFLTSFPDGRTRELVITRVSKDGAMGYVLVPAQDAATLTAANRARVE